LAETLLKEVGNEPGNLPLLEFALKQLWERQTDQELTHEAYQDIGGVNQALANHAEEVFARFKSDEQVRLRWIFIKLVRPGEGIEDTRQMANIEQIKENRDQNTVSANISKNCVLIPVLSFVF
jgi:hypothetical protein